MATADALLDALYRDPDSDAPRLVYADFLSDQGNALGEFIRVQVARANSDQRTKSREEALLAEHGAEWWPGHPAWFCFPDGIGFERVHRGFPVSMGLLAPSFQRQEWSDGLAALHSAPGWATVESITVNGGMATPEVLPVLRNSPLRALKMLRGFDAAALDQVGYLNLPVQLLELRNETNRALAPIVGLPRLMVLRLDLSNTVPEEAVALALPCGITGRLKRLELHGASGAIEQHVAAFRQLPESLGELSVSCAGNPIYVLSGDRAAPSLKLLVDSDTFGRIAEELELLPKNVLTRVDVELSKVGIAKSEVPAVQQRMAAATARWR